ncbi:MAG: hypothetical protein CMJ82_05145 [Planctomycetaceae bacterium]|nr:hypothetical protein [Planctomycetaceae bacterium]
MKIPAGCRSNASPWCALLLVFEVLNIAFSPRIYAADFNKDIRPLLSNHCFECHGPDHATRQADLRLDIRQSAMSVIIPGKIKQSELIRRIHSDDPDLMMPPADAKNALTTEQKKLLTDWVRQGADFQQHWSFEPVQKQISKPHRSDRWSRGPIDVYVYNRLREENLHPTRQADKATLLRRISFDLTGLPPSLEDATRILSDDSPQAIERYIDQLMQSPAFGEHMALYWLEASRYADTDGYQNDRTRHHHVWRDWVIMAFNENMPYDQFIVDQLAGDQKPDATLKSQIATAFCRNHRINSEDGSIPGEWHVENVADRVDTFGTVFLGLTVSCSRCHDHKFDPITQRDYYELFAYFNNNAEWGVGPNNGNSPPFIEIPETWPEIPEELDKPAIPEPLKLTNARKEAGNGLKRPQPGSATTLMIMHDLENPRETYLLNRGQYNLPDKSQQLYPTVPSALDFNPELQPKTRYELAQWLIHPEHPLTARVAVNRFWQQIFGQGIVESSENFGSQGSLPSHPALLDYLATNFIQSGWNTKALLKQILLSATYQQSSDVSPELIQRDPKNVLLARGPRIRLSGFALRDQALVASSLYVSGIGGPSVKPYMPPRIWRSISNNSYKQDAGDNLYRRSLYTYWRRTIPPPTMMNFNAAAREVCIVRTEQTNTPLQALTLLNNIIFIESARNLAQQAILHGGASETEQIKFAFQSVLTRTPTAHELQILRESLVFFRQRYAEHPDEAQALIQVGDSKIVEELDKQQLAALTMVASTIFNLDEAITKR